MHRAIEITAPPASINALIRDLEKSDHLISLSVHCGASIKPPGDVLMVHALNRDADRVMRLVDKARMNGQISVTTHELTSIVDPEREREVAKDFDETLWVTQAGVRAPPEANSVVAVLSLERSRDDGRKILWQEPSASIHQWTRFRCWREPRE